jgi:polysaccharide pyruvyl transferase WcaK-like protein
MSKLTKKVVVCGVPGSDNLGDAVIADCLVGFIQQKQNYTAIRCDISYRENVVYDSVKGKKLGWFHNMPQVLRQLFVLSFFTLKYLLKGRAFLREKMQGADLVVVGGGQLFSDVDWNFPLKLYFVVKMAEKMKVPVRVCAVGVAGKWSKFGTFLINELLTSPQVELISVRDELSQIHIRKFFSIDNAILLPDPAVMSSILNPLSRSKESFRNTIGIGVADIIGLNYSSDKVNDSDSNSLESWGRLTDILTADGTVIVLFTNGALEDEYFLHHELVPYLTRTNRKFDVNPRFVSSDQMVQFLANLHSLYAFRLHANIVAASYNVLHFAIGWDNKVISFFNLQCRDHAVFNSLDALVLAINEKRLALQYNSDLTPKKVENMYLEFFRN